MRIRQFSYSVAISIHAPLAGCDLNSRRSEQTAKNFNPRTPCGVRPRMNESKESGHNFNPRTPCGVRLTGVNRICRPVHISIHAPLAGCDLRSDLIYSQRAISIHAPLAGCDSQSERIRHMASHISIHAPLAGCDTHRWQFQTCRKNFNPRTPCGVRPGHRSCRSES